MAAVCIASVGCSGLNGEGENAKPADLVPLAARVDQLDGEVALGRYNDTQNTKADRIESNWAQASVNTPVSPGSRVYVKDRSNVGIAFSGRNYARLNPRTSLDVLSLTQQRTQLALREGAGIFDVGELTSGDLFEVATPNGAINFQERGLYQVGIDDRGSTLVTVLSGLAQIVGLGGSGQVARGQLLTFGGPNGSAAYVSQLDPTVCGNITDAYYAFRYPEAYDGRYSDYATYQNDPYYTNPYRRSTSYRYIPDDTEVAGLYDLDYYGDWQNVRGYGDVWSPRVNSDWAPYRDGYWYDDQPLGLTWISNEPWGWAPYHYGRWVSVDQRWFWVPGEIVSRPVYAPALVAFVPFTQEDRIGWLPLGPGDPYVYRYYDDNYQPHYLGSSTAVTNIVNYNVPGAVTVVRTTEFIEGVRPATVLTVDSELLARSRPVLDPYEVPKIKELAPRLRSQGRRVHLPDTAHLAMNRTVVTSRDPILPAVVSNKAGALKFKSVPEAEGKRKLSITKKEAVIAIRPDGLPAPVDAPGVGKRELRQLEEQRREQERVDGRKRPQASATDQQQIRQQQTQQPKVERKAAPQQVPIQRQQQKQMQKPERKAAPQPQQPIPQQQRIQQQQQQQQQQRVQQPQQKVERKAAQPQGQPANPSPSKAGKKPENPKGKGKP